jgi:hypothetical protein
MMGTIDDAFIKEYIKRYYQNQEVSSNYDSDEYDSDEYDSDGCLLDNIRYEPEEPSKTRYNIVLCELHNPKMHGISPETNVGQHYLVNSRYKSLHIKFINANANAIIHPYIISLWRHSEHTKNHPIYKNYTNIVSRLNYIKPEIAECIYLETQECVAILKTFWVRLIQRTWKNILRRRKEIIKKRSNPHYLHIKQITGKWPKECLSYPQLKGMLSSIKKL